MQELSQYLKKNWLIVILGWWGLLLALYMLLQIVLIRSGMTWVTLGILSLFAVATYYNVVAFLDLFKSIKQVNFAKKLKSILTYVAIQIKKNDVMAEILQNEMSIAMQLAKRDKIILKEKEKYNEYVKLLITC